MKAVRLKEYGDISQLYFGETPTPSPLHNEVLVKVEAAALNRADILQRKGHYPPPKGESEILGLEMAGTIVELGSEVSRWKVGDRVCGIIAGGGYAEYAKIHENMALPVPEQMPSHQAAAIPEVFLTAFQALHWITELKEGESVLIHAGASGVGTAAIQLAKKIGTTIFVTASAAKHEACKKLGAHHTIDYKSEDFETVVLALTENRGVDVIVDFIGGPYWHSNIKSLAMDGRMVNLALLGGGKVDNFHLGQLLRKRLNITASTLRNRSLAYKIALTKAFHQYGWPSFMDGTLTPVVDKVFPWQEVAAAHTYMEENRNVGKIVLRVL
jgi:tumor protein p53-inducible protein 3